ncbi:uncharacterized protein LOC120710603 [Panicum virgatum]|uniref:uncharacterized protein LOC120710603 n=1 Tax=Panicum virgatum TaxID=38727 RepID=UPI0019D5B2D2|nr:uncharacterized protein LOC120710603 [Panicum virgatum]
MQAVWKVSTGHTTGAFGSLPDEDLHPYRADFPRGNESDLQTSGVLPRLDSTLPHRLDTPPKPIATTALSSSSAAARRLGRTLLLLPRHHRAYALSSSSSPATAAALSSIATARRLAVLFSIATTSDHGEEELQPRIDDNLRQLVVGVEGSYLIT